MSVTRLFNTMEEKNLSGQQFREEEGEQSGFRARRTCNHNTFWLKQVIEK